MSNRWNIQENFVLHILQIHRFKKSLEGWQPGTHCNMDGPDSEDLVQPQTGPTTAAATPF